MTRRARTLTTLAVTLVAAAAAVFALADQPAIPPIDPPPRPDPARIAQGAELAAIGDCAVCHTAPGGPALAGGRPIPTPFGTVTSTNITPDPDTGIGRWSGAAFRRAMRDGIARDARHLYPVLPYPHFTRATDNDIDALYAFLMSRQPVPHGRPPNTLPFPFNQRTLLAGWNLLYLRPGPWQPDPANDAEWNRGAYLAEAAGHCGACHTPHNPLGAEQDSRPYAGGQAEDWPAPALQIDSPAPRPWTEATLATYLATGYQSGHGAAAGPMNAVTQQLSRVPEADIHALAHYFASLMPQAPIPPASTPNKPELDPRAAATFDGACGSCHADNAPMTQNGAPSLALSSAVNAPTPDGVVQIILNGIPWRDGAQSAYMPAYAAALTDAQIAQLTAYIRARYAAKPAPAGLESEVAKARQAGG